MQQCDLVVLCDMYNRDFINIYRKCRNTGQGLFSQTCDADFIRSYGYAEYDDTIGYFGICIGLLRLSGVELHISRAVLLVPVLIIQTGLLGLGCGIIVAALTTKYRDLVILVSFGVQLWMYTSPVVYTFSQIPEKYLSFYLLNPMVPIITVWRHAILGTKGIQGIYWGISWLITVAVLFTGIILFSRIERTFMDTV